MDLLFVFTVFLIIESVQLDDFKYMKTKFNLKYTTINRDVNTSTTYKTCNVKTLTACSYKCCLDVNSSLYYIPYTQECYCNKYPDTNNDHDSTKPAIVYGYYTKLVVISTYTHFKKWNVSPTKEDCLELYNEGYTEDGVYVIQPTGQNPTNAWCDMTGGGWTVLQKRQDGSEDFYRGWSDYVSGFGNRTGEYWLGLDNIHSLTTRASELHIYVETFGDRTPVYAETRFGMFKVDGASLNYILHVANSSSSCGDDPFHKYGNGNAFSTYDSDNDIYYANCAVKYKGAWWYSNCHDINLNGYYHGGAHSSFADGVTYKPCWGHYYSVKISIMKLRRN